MGIEGSAEVFSAAAGLGRVRIEVAALLGALSRLKHEDGLGGT